MLFYPNLGLFLNPCAGDAVGWCLEMLLDRFPLPLVLPGRAGSWDFTLVPEDCSLNNPGMSRAALLLLPPPGSSSPVLLHH